MKILLSNSGRRAYLVNYLLDLKKNYNKKIKIFVSDTSINRSSFWVSRNVKQIITPRVSGNENKFIIELFKECLKNKIDLIIPLMDYEIYILSLNIEKFRRIGTNILISSPSKVLNCIDKVRNYHFCKINNLLTPKHYDRKKLPLNKKIVVKKKIGSGSRDIFTGKAADVKKLKFDKSFFFQEYIHGQEYGIDILNDLEGNFLHCCIKKKYSMRDGETEIAEVVYNKTLISLSKKISSALRHIGNLDIDLITDKKNNNFLLDFNLRFGGGYPFTHNCGFNYIKSIIKLYDKKTVKFVKNKKTHFYGIKSFDVLKIQKK